MTCRLQIECRKSQSMFSLPSRLLLLSRTSKATLERETSYTLPSNAAQSVSGRDYRIIACARMWCASYIISGAVDNARPRKHPRLESLLSEDPAHCHAEEYVSVLSSWNSRDGNGCITPALIHRNIVVSHVHSNGVAAF